jgi:hypothetical protein
MSLSQTNMTKLIPFNKLTIIGLFIATALYTNKMKVICMILLLGIAYTGKSATNCPIPRPEICTQQFDPVCGIRADGTRATYSNSCVACSKTQKPLVIAWIPGACNTTTNPTIRAVRSTGSVITSPVQTKGVITNSPVQSKNPITSNIIRSSILPTTSVVRSPVQHKGVITTSPVRAKNVIAHPVTTQQTTELISSRFIR